ncbi:MAG: glycosyltransferase [Herbaspirillum sp.]
MQNPDKTPFHIAFGVDAHYFRAMGVAMISIIENNRDENLVFHLFASLVSDDDQKKLHCIEADHGVAIVVHIIDPSAFDEYVKFPSFSQYSAAIFTRLLIPNALRGVADKVLYLDSDILCIGGITELMAMDISDSIVAVVHDNGVETVRRQCESLNLQDGRYFNSGVLLINIDNWISSDITRNTMRTLLLSSQKFIFPDQDALNVVLDGKAKFIAEKWNFQYNLNSFLNAGSFSVDGMGDAVFVHFTGRVKPWHDWSLHEARTLFVKYQLLSPWAGMPLDAPKNHKEMRLFSQFLAVQGHKIRAALWFAKYLVEKLTMKSD